MVCMFMYINICILYTNHTHTHVYMNNCINIIYQTVSSKITSFVHCQCIKNKQVISLRGFPRRSCSFRALASSLENYYDTQGTPNSSGGCDPC